MKDLSTLRETVQTVRARSFTELPSDLVDEVLTIEGDSHEDRLQARERVSALLSAYLTAMDSA